MQRTGLALCTIGPKDDGEEEDFDVEDAYWDSFTPQEMSQLLTTIDEAGRPGKTTCTLDAPLELATQSNSVGPLGSASKVPPASSLPSSSTTSSVGLTAPASLNNDGTLRSEVLDKALGSDEAEEDAYWDNLSQASLEALEDQLRLASSQAISPGTKCLASRATTKMATIGKDEKRNGLNSSRHDKSSPPVTSPGSPTRSSRTLRSQASPPKHPYRGIYVPQFESRRGQSSGSTGGNASRAAERGLKTQTGGLSQRHSSSLAPTQKKLDRFKFSSQKQSLSTRIASQEKGNREPRVVLEGYAPRTPRSDTGGSALVEPKTSVTPAGPAHGSPVDGPNVTSSVTTPAVQLSGEQREVLKLVLQG